KPVNLHDRRSHPERQERASKTQRRLALISRNRRCSGVQQSKQLPGKERALPGLLVLEVHEDFGPASGGVLETLCPGSQICVRVVRLAQTEVAKICSLLERRAALIMLGDAQCRIEAAQAFVQVVGEPALIAELERRSESGRQLMEEILESGNVLLEKGR